MQADLHLHSIYSDGLYSPDEICKIAKSRGLTLLSITDHDTLLGETEKIAAAKKYGLSYLSGWEISAYDLQNKIHVLGYGCTPSAAYERFIKERLDGSMARVSDSIGKLRKMGIDVRLEDVLAERLHADAPVHTMHLARALAKRLGVSEGEAYLAYLNVGKAAYSELGRPTPREAIDCIHALGGLASLAHPGRISMTDGEKESLIRSLADYGLDGIEVFYTTHTARETEYFSALAGRFSLLETGGSDTHFEDGTHAVGTPFFEAGERLLSRVRLTR